MNYEYLNEKGKPVRSTYLKTTPLTSKNPRVFSDEELKQKYRTSRNLHYLGAGLGAAAAAVGGYKAYKGSRLLGPLLLGGGYLGMATGMATGSMYDMQKSHLEGLKRTGFTKGKYFGSPHAVALGSNAKNKQWQTKKEWQQHYDREAKRLEKEW